MEERSPARSQPSVLAASVDFRAPLLVCFSHLRWDFVWQRPQHLLSRAAKRYRVLYIEEPVFKPGVTPYMDVSARPGNVVVAVPTLPDGMQGEAVLAAQRTLIDRLLARDSGEQRVLWYYTPMALAFTSHLDADLVVFDNMDELSLFAGASQEIIDLETALLARSDVVFTGGMSLYEAKRSRHRNIHGLPSSIEFDHFARARKLTDADPKDQASIPHPRLGFFGVIDERMDVSLVGEVAALRRDWHFVMIGPVVKIDWASLPQGDNIHWLGPKDYKDLPRYLGRWDIGFMPFALNEATRFISPTKTPEFLAAGVPVVSTPITDVVRPYGDKGLVEIASTAPEVVGKVEQLLARPKEAWLQRVDRHLAAGSWEKTWATMHRLMQDALGEGASRPSEVTRPTAPPSYALTPGE
jgi:glycosyltransferase involved in cell wall biosynthesis